jgi:hypothetical protein
VNDSVGSLNQSRGDMKNPNRKNPLSKSTSSFVGSSSQMLKANALKAAQNLLNKGDVQN